MTHRPRSAPSIAAGIARREVTPLMTLLFHSAVDDPIAWRRELAKAGVDRPIVTLEDDPNLDWVDAALVWLPPAGLLASCSNLRAIFSLGAGVDAMLLDPTLPADKPLCRMVDPVLTRTMVEFVVAACLRHHRDLDLYASRQALRRWSLRPARMATERPIGVMGHGELGRACIAALADLGFPMRVWSRRRAENSRAIAFAGSDELPAFAAQSDILVCLLPLTEATTGILNRDLFALLPRGAALVNVARGAHQNEADIIDALDAGRLGSATLDVFATEPLPADNPLWDRADVLITPHAAAYTGPESGARCVAENLRRLDEGRPLLHVVDRERGY